MDRICNPDNKAGYLENLRYRSPQFLCFSYNPASGDWYCPKCNNMNYARRTQCNREGCDFEKKDLDDYGSRYINRKEIGRGPIFKDLHLCC